ncbi:MAG TPA: phytoene/squalene synthase family protein [Chitinophagales bacterium]|nr:phytoene/squalene synthase family protein [Chitinophagales bacterium]
MFEIYEHSAFANSRSITRLYSTSFSKGISALHKKFHDPIYGIYGFVRYTDEIVDTFFQFNQSELLEEFKAETYKAIERKISLNPVLHAFQSVVHQFKIDHALIEAFFRSMEMDLHQKKYEQEYYAEYIYGSAEVVGLMCLRVFTEGDELKYNVLKKFAQSLGAAFQKVNFLRDVKSDFEERGRIYFPGVNFNAFTEEMKVQIEKDIQQDFNIAYEGILKLPKTSRFGVYLAYIYYLQLFKQIKRVRPSQILTERISVPQQTKMRLLFETFFREKLNLL